MLNKKVFIIVRENTLDLENAINKFICHKTINSIQYQISRKSQSQDIYSAMIVYLDKKLRG